MRQTGEMQDTIRLANVDFTFFAAIMSSYAFPMALKRLVLLCEYVVVWISEGPINLIATKMHINRMKILSI